MKSLPMSLRLYGITMWCIAFSFPLQVLFLQDQPLYKYFQSWHFLSDLNFLTMAATWALSYHSFKASKRIFYIAPLACLIMAFNNWWVGFINFDYSMWQTGLATFGFVTSQLVLFEPKAQQALKNPSLHWWRTSERKSTHLPVTIHPWIGASFATESINISESGILISSGDGDLKPGEFVHLRMNFDGVHDIRCSAKVVRRSTNTNSLTTGFGLVFNEITSADRRFIRDYQSRPQSEAQFAA